MKPPAAGQASSPAPKSDQRPTPALTTTARIDPNALAHGRVRLTRSDQDPRSDLKQSPPPPVRPSNTTLSAVAAISGAALAVFVAIHMFGNLKVYAGPVSFNDYAHWLRHAGYPLLPAGGLLWAFRIGLLLAALAHIWATLLKTLRAHRGAHRPQVSAKRRGASLISRGMWISGLLLLVFAILHILDLTTGTVAVDFQAPTSATSFAYSNLVASLSRPSFALLYAGAMLALLVHLLHGLWLLASDLGVTGNRTRKAWHILAHLIALIIAAGNLSIPLAIYLGVIGS